MNKYYLISKIHGISFVKYKGDAVRICEQTPYSVDEVWVGIRKKPQKAWHITTFRDSNGRIIERAFDNGENYYRNRLYTRSENIIGDDEFVESTTIKEFKIPKRLYPASLQLLKEYKDAHPFKTILWTPIQTITNHFSSNVKTGEEILSQTKITNMEKPTKEVHSIIEFPHIVDRKIQKTKKKVLQFIVNSLDRSVTKGTITAKGGVRKPKEDSFLAFRTLDIDDMKYDIIEKFLKDKKLSKADVKIDVNYPPKEKEENCSALFYYSDGSIRVNKKFKFKSKSQFTKTAGHETEHVWQWVLHARNTGGSTIWQVGIAETFGKIKTLEMRKEAKQYTKSINNYIPHDRNFKAYQKNFVERKAEEAGEKAQKAYDREGKTVRSNFKHIPKELL